MNISGAKLMRRQWRQQGITLSGLITSAILLGVVALVGMKLWPIYNEKMKVDLAMKNVSGQVGVADTGLGNVLKAMLRNFEVSDVDRFDLKSLRKVSTLEKIKGSPDKNYTVAYEIRAPFFGNLDIVMKYSNTVRLEAAGS